MLDLRDICPPVLLSCRVYPEFMHELLMHKDVPLPLQTYSYQLPRIVEAAGPMDESLG